MSEHDKGIMEFCPSTECESIHDQPMNDIEPPERIMEIRPHPAKQKRGRPDVFIRYYGFESGNDVRKGYEWMWNKYKSKSRSISNLFYALHGDFFVEEHISPELYQYAFRREGGEGLRNKIVLEQIGRALLQNHLSDEDCQKLTLRAIERLRDGYHSTWVAKYLRGMRNDLASHLQRDL